MDWMEIPSGLYPEDWHDTNPGITKHWKVQINLGQLIMMVGET